MAPRRAAIVVVALALVVFAVETSVHSVHHLTDRHAASQCVVASASMHVAGTEQPHTPDGACVSAPTALVAAIELLSPGSRPLRPDLGRAPPAV